MRTALLAACLLSVSAIAPPAHPANLLARAFLSDFARSDQPVAATMRHFEPTCPGTLEESEDVAANRATRRMTSIHFEHLQTTTGPCAFRKSWAAAQSEACTVWRVEFRGVLLETGAPEVAHGIAHIGAVTRQGHWRLCSSEWENAETPDDLALRATKYR